MPGAAFLPGVRAFLMLGTVNPRVLAFTALLRGPVCRKGALPLPLILKECSGFYFNPFATRDLSMGQVELHCLGL